MMIKQEKYVSDLFKLLDMKTVYNNKYPYNIGYVNEDGVRSFDCWNLIKSLLNGYDISNTKEGYKCPTLSITGDIDGKGLLNKCSGKSKDFSKIKTYPAGTYLYMEIGKIKHAGTYVGEFERNGNTYNVIECTSSWGGCVLASWVDEDGTRRQYKDGRKSRNWTDYGLLTKWVDYENKEEQVPDTKTDVEKISIPPYFIRYGNRSNFVKDLQTILSQLGYIGADNKPLELDGIFGVNTKYAVRSFQKDTLLISDGIYGPKTYEKLKKVYKEDEL